MKRIASSLLVLFFFFGCTHSRLPVSSEVPTNGIQASDEDLLDQFENGKYASREDVDKAFDGIYERLQKNNSKIRLIEIFIDGHRSKAAIKHIVNQLTDPSFKNEHIDKVLYTRYMYNQEASTDELKVGIVACLKNKRHGRDLHIILNLLSDRLDEYYFDDDIFSEIARLSASLKDRGLYQKTNRIFKSITDYRAYTMRNMEGTRNSQ